MLSESTLHFPTIVEVSKRIACQKASHSDFEYMAAIRDALDCISCYKFSPIINDIISAHKISEDDFAASCARIFLSVFNTVYDQLKDDENTQELELSYNLLEATDLI